MKREVKFAINDTPEFFFRKALGRDMTEKRIGIPYFNQFVSRNFNKQLLS